jgi:hypothetical protein
MGGAHREEDMGNQAMGRGGTEESGYSVSVDAPARTIRVEAWGFWSVEVCSTFGKALLDACRSSPVRRVEMETSRLKPLREEGENAWAMAMGALPGVGIEAVVVKTNSLTKLQLLRIARHSASKDMVQFV